jgi:16S rRNA (guanine527-N7)-methyltransferase
MQIARIADLLDPFLRAPTELSTHCHSEPAKAGEEPAVPSAVASAVPSAMLSPAQQQDISTYIDILIRWNARINLTAIRDPEDIVTRHFGESLFAARHLFPVPSSVLAPVSSVPTACPDAGRVVKDFGVPHRVADVGSGAGFPGLPIKLWAPGISLTLIESNHKKATFLREVTRALTLTNVNIQNTRAESISGAFDVVTLRAVESFSNILPTAAALLAPSGRLALLISTAQQEEARHALPHLLWSLPLPIPRSRARILLIARSSPPNESHEPTK